MSRHGTYARVEPPGARVARYYCRKGQTTFSLLPDCLASRLSSTMQEVEQVVEVAEAAESLWVAAEQLRPDIDLLSAARWVRRRVKGVRGTLVVLLGLLPELLAGVEPSIASFRPVLGTEAVLVEVRHVAAEHLGALPPPVGFGPRQKVLPPICHRLQHDVGPDPPLKTR